MVFYLFRRLRMVQSAQCSLHNSNDELFPPNFNNHPHSDSECNMSDLAGQVNKSL